MNNQDPNWDFISTAEDDYVYQQQSPIENSPLPQPKLWPQTKTCSTLLHATKAEDCSDIFKHLSNVQLHSHSQSESAETTNTTSTHQTWRRGESSGTKRKCNEMELPQSTQSKGNDGEARKKRNRDDMPPKKTRSAATRNISERRRRDKINGKIRTLQELIPNCRKSGRASVLDDAIEYIKVLQRQVQTITMGGGAPYQTLYMPTTGYQGLQLPHFSPYVSMRPRMGMGMGIGIGFGLKMYRMPCSSVLPSSIRVPSPILNPSMSTVSDLPGLYESGALPIPQVQQLQLNSSHLFPAQSSTSIAPSIYVARCTTQGESSSQTMPRIADENHHMPSQVWAT